MNLTTITTIITVCVILILPIGEATCVCRDLTDPNDIGLVDPRPLPTPSAVTERGQ